MAPSPQDSDVAGAVNKLSLSTPNDSAKPTKKKTKKVVADSWEDEDVSDSEPETETKAAEDEVDDDDDGDDAPSKPPAPPPPTPLSPVGPSWSASEGLPTSRAPDGGPRRPEKTDAVARRMIAAGLGLKAPKQTEEQRAYQKSIREQEKKRREQERAAEKKAQEDAEKAKAAMWDD
ncbi:hypothetical protein B0T10DRAFT_557998 [Thelonectria olida]|uniref:Uncharacterized protein n=1 Tax=Thelonectria olida TaxID=1576542 RepID=A0A9P9AUL1_9HYPO|nr:hypothetical protein B0T10DRAFT_557998 [Thelonectria olida]